MAGVRYVWPARGRLRRDGRLEAVLFTLLVLSGGLGFQYYTDFESSTLRFRPEVGVGIPWARLNMGINIPITGSGRIIIPF
jgi:hypothetical protein